MTLAERFWPKVDVRGPDECWPWTAATFPKGYGKIGRGGRAAGVIEAHRASWLLAHGPIPDGLCVLHSCDNPPCVNPAHLFLGTLAENVADMMAKGRHRNGVSRGEANGRAKLTAGQVDEIRGRARGGGESRAALARIFGVSWPTIDRIVRGTRWREEVAADG